MKKAPYLSSNELTEFLKLGVIADVCELIITTTKDKDWSKRLKTASTHLHKLVEERIACLDLNQVESLLRRKSHTALRLYTSDAVRVDDKKYPVGVTFEKVTMDIESLQDMAELALCACQSCPQGELVKTCKFRRTMHTLGIPVARDEVGETQCEFRSDDEARCIPPHVIRQEIDVI